jgi:ABC-type transport system substrate-binding protein
MKFYTAFLFASFVGAASAFSAVAPSSSAAATGKPAPVDKTMEGIDSAPDTFDPTEGENPALARNNLGEVWNPQVRLEKCEVICQHLYIFKKKDLIFSNFLHETL